MTEKFLELVKITSSQALDSSEFAHISAIASRWSALGLESPLLFMRIDSNESASRILNAFCDEGLMPVCWLPLSGCAGSGFDWYSLFAAWRSEELFEVMSENLSEMRCSFVGGRSTRQAFEDVAAKNLSYYKGVNTYEHGFLVEIMDAMFPYVVQQTGMAIMRMGDSPQWGFTHVCGAISNPLDMDSCPEIVARVDFV